MELDVVFQESISYLGIEYSEKKILEAANTVLVNFIKKPCRAVITKYRHDNERRCAKETVFANKTVIVAINAINGRQACIEPEKFGQGVYQKITQEMEDFFKLKHDEAARNRFTKFLMRDYHPDKNREKYEEANRVFQHIQNESERLKKKLKIFEADSDTSDIYYSDSE